MIQNSWKSQFTIKGQQGISAVKDAGNVIYSGVKFVVTLRTPPSLKCEEIKDLIKQELERQDEGTFGAQINVTDFDVASGFLAPQLPENLDKAFKQHTTEVYGESPLFMGGGGSIPFMGVFQGHFPDAAYVLTGACLPTGNIHAANENLDLEFTKKFTQVIARFLASV